jgi:hypothetical protein
LDFDTNITLAGVRNSADDGFVRTAFLRQNESGWEAGGDDIEIQQGGIAVNESKNSLTLSAVLRRKTQTAKKQDFCFSIDVIAEEKHMSGAVCRSVKSELGPIDELFRGKPVIFLVK